MAGSISVISFAHAQGRRDVAASRAAAVPTWAASRPTGKVLWLSGRYDGVVYAISTRTGQLLAQIPVGQGPHGLCVWPQPGRYSLGHTGDMR